MKNFSPTQSRSLTLVLLGLLALTLAAVPPSISRLRSSVVTIYAYDRQGGQSLGTGWLISDREVVTCFHVIEGSERAEVMTDDHRRMRVTSIAVADPEGDLAILTIPPQSIDPLTLAGRPPRVGERVYVLNTPHGLRSTLGDEVISTSPQTEGVNNVHVPITVGAVSAFRKIGPVTMVQFTAPITHGCSGSAVVNAQGEVVAVVQSMDLDGMYYGVDASRVRRNLGGPQARTRPHPSTSTPGPSNSNSTIFESAKGNPRPMRPRPNPRTETRPVPGSPSAPSTRPRPQAPRPQPGQPDDRTVYDTK